MQGGDCAVAQGPPSLLGHAGARNDVDRDFLDLGVKNRKIDISGGTAVHFQRPDYSLAFEFHDGFCPGTVTFPGVERKSQKKLRISRVAELIRRFTRQPR